MTNEVIQGLKNIETGDIQWF